MYVSRFLWSCIQKLSDQGQPRFSWQYVSSFPRPCLLLYSICIFIGDYSVACHRLQYGRSCTSLIKIFVSVLVFLYVNLEVSVYFSAGRKIWKRRAKHVFNNRRVKEYSAWLAWNVSKRVHTLHRSIVHNKSNEATLWMTWTDFF